MFKKSVYVSLSLIVVLFNVACEESPYTNDDYEAPAVPRGVGSITGDEAVFLSWYPNHESDLDGYNVYRSFQLDDGYARIATTDSPFYTDYNVQNGETYYYAITAFDYDYNESELSFDEVFDTPRPEGEAARMYDLHQYPDVAAYDFSRFRIRDVNDSRSDISFEYHAESDGYYINALDSETWIQDYGYTESLDDISYAPEEGWSMLGYSEAIVGHTYVIWTNDNHFAKIRITAVNRDLVEFDWAYQVDEGNPELVQDKTPIQIATK